MRVTCPSCQTNYSIDDKRIPSGGAKLKCAKCQAIFPIGAQAVAAMPAQAIPLPGAAAPAAAAGGMRGSAPAASRSVPLPGAVPGPISKTASSAGAPVPLPGSNGGRVANFEHALQSAALPLPGERRAQLGSTPAIPLPATSWDDEKTREISQPIAGAKPAPIQLPGFDPVSNDLDVGFADADLVEPPHAAQQASAVPMPGSDPSWDESSFDLPPPSDSTFSAVDDGGVGDFSGLGNNGDLSAAAPDQFDLSAFGPPPERAPAEAAPSTEAEPSFEDFPDLASARPSAEPNAASGAVDELNFDLIDPVAPAPSEAPARPRVQTAPPEAAPSNMLPEVPSVELEADGAAEAQEVDFDVSEAPPEQPSTEKLEELSFVDDSQSAESKSAATRHYVRRKTGKIFGPFDESVIAKMLEAGQLIGAEEISLDKQEWSPLGSVPHFQELIDRLLKSPPEPTASAPAIAPQTPEMSATMDRLKRLYDGRMAAVSVVHGRSFRDRLGNRVPVLIGVSGLVALIVAGGPLGFTRYGVFGLKKLFPARIAKSSQQFTMLQDARKGLLTDTFKSYKDAHELSATVLKVGEYPEARAIWCQSVFYLQRRYAAATPADVAKANAALQPIRSLGQRNLELVKTLAGAALAASRPTEVLSALQDATARKENDADMELGFLLAEAYALQGQRKLAVETLNRLLAVQKNSAKALHALGNLYQSGNEPDKAAKAYADALEADPKHAASAVELAAVELLLRKNVQAASDALERALEPATQSLLGPAELARAHALKGAKLGLEFKPREASVELEESLKLDPRSNFARARLATLLLSQREYARAAVLFKDVLSSEPQNIEATDGYLSALIGAGKMEDALTSVAQANVRFPGNARIAYLYGRINDVLDKPTEAEKHYKRAISANPKLLEPTLYLARLYLRFRRVDEAKAQLEAAAVQAPDDPQVHVGLGELALGEHDLARSKLEYERAKTLDPSVAEAHLGLSRVALENGSLQEATESIERALQLDANVKGGMLQHGLVLWKTGKGAEAVSELKKAKAQDPKSSLVAITVGAVMLDQGDLAGSEANLLSALAIDPASPEAHFYLAKLKSRRGEYNQAIDTMKTALERAPKRAGFHYELGLIYRDAKKLSDAIPEWKRTVELDPTHADGLEALGQAYLDRGEFEQAVSSFDASIRADPTRTRVLGLIGDAFFQAAKWDQAISKYHQALKTDQTLTNVYYRLGRAYTEKGQHAQAITWYLKATEADVKNPLPYYYLGYAYKEKHRRQEAIDAFKHYLALKEKPEDRKEIEDEIYDLEHERE